MSDFSILMTIVKLEEDPAMLQQERDRVRYDEPIIQVVK